MKTQILQMILVLLMGIPAWAQEGTITGKVTDGPAGEDRDDSRPGVGRDRDGGPPAIGEALGERARALHPALGV
jgi:hypothetical protein